MAMDEEAGDDAGGLQGMNAEGRELAAKKEKSGREPAMRVREDFRTAIFWEPSLRTDEAGRARVEGLRYGESLTRWRITAKSVDADTRVGTGRAFVRTRRNVSARLTLPRFLRAGRPHGVPRPLPKPHRRVRGRPLLRSGSGVAGGGRADHARGGSAPSRGDRLRIRGRRYLPLRSQDPLGRRQRRRTTHAARAPAGDPEGRRPRALREPGGRQPVASRARACGAGHDHVPHPPRAGVRKRHGGRAPLPPRLPVRLHGADDEPLRAAPGGDRGLEGAGSRPRRTCHRASRDDRGGAGSPGAPPARRRRLRLVGAGRDDGRRHDGARRARALTPARDGPDERDGEGHPRPRRRCAGGRPSEGRGDTRPDGACLGDPGPRAGRSARAPGRPAGLRRALARAAADGPRAGPARGRGQRERGAHRRPPRPSRRRGPAGRGTPLVVSASRGRRRSR